MKNKKRCIIIHGWDSSPEKAWYQSMKRNLESDGYKVIIPKMPGTRTPNIDKWVSHISKIVKIPDNNTFFIGHSIGCQAIMRYLESINVKVGGCVFVAGWFELKEFAYKEFPEYGDEVRNIARPWVESKIDLKKVRANSKHITAIFSDDDYYVDLKNSDIFKKDLGAKIIIEHKKGHFSEVNGIKDIPIVYQEISKMLKS